MAKRKDIEAPAVTKTAAETPTPNATANLSAPLAVETPKIEAAAEPPKIELAKIELPKIDSPSIDVSKIEPLKTEPSADPIAFTVSTPFTPKPFDAIKPEIKPEIAPEIAAAAQAADASPGRSHRFAMLAASVAMAAAIGAIVGAAATAGIWQATATPASDTAASETRALRETVVRVSTELTTLKAHIDAGNRTATTQLQQLAQRIDRAEKAQAEPAARLAKIIESLDRLERRSAVPMTNASLTQPQQLPPPQAPTLAAAPPPSLAPASPDVTGSINIQGKPLVVEGWVLHDFYAGRVVLENRATGALYEVGPGSNLPGVGRVESIKREDNRVIVVTAKGIISSALEPPRRRSSYMPYR